MLCLSRREGESLILKTSDGETTVTQYTSEQGRARVSLMPCELWVSPEKDC